MYLRPHAEWEGNKYTISHSRIQFERSKFIFKFDMTLPGLRKMKSENKLIGANKNFDAGTI